MDELTPGAGTIKAEIADCFQKLVQIAIDHAGMGDRFAVACQPYNGGGYGLDISDGGDIRGAFCFFPEIHDVDMLIRMTVEQCRRYADG